MTDEENESSEDSGAESVSPKSPSEEPSAPIGQMLGSVRWVQFFFIGGALLAFWFFGHVIRAVWNQFAEPDGNIVTALAGLGAVALALVFYKVPRYNKFMNEVISELMRVTWPTRKETWSQSTVVIIVSIIAAVILGAMDAVWAQVTDLIYLPPPPSA